MTSLTAFVFTSLTNYDRVFIALQRLTNKHVVFIHGEAKGYAFKTFDGEWHTIGYGFANDMAGLGYVEADLT